jgi:hypothetical protein
MITTRCWKKDSSTTKTRVTTHQIITCISTVCDKYSMKKIFEDFLDTEQSDVMTVHNDDVLPDTT